MDFTVLLGGTRCLVPLRHLGADGVDSGAARGLGGGGARRRLAFFNASRFTAPLCAFAQPLHQRFFPSAGSPKLGAFSLQASHFL